jgi:predicted nucleic acid-binding protein
LRRITFIGCNFDGAFPATTNSVLSIIIQKLSDKSGYAIFAATAINNNAVLITNDQGFSKIPLLQTASF